MFFQNDKHPCKGLLGHLDLFSQSLLFFNRVYNKHEFDVFTAPTGLESLNMFNPIRDNTERTTDCCFETDCAKTKAHSGKHGNHTLIPLV